VWIGQWIGGVGPQPKPWVCLAAGCLTDVHNWDADEVWVKFGPLRLIWRDGQVMTAGHASELPNGA
jgi:hypothetical protein